MNKWTGEKEIEIDGRAFLMRPSFEAIVEIESIVDGSMVEVFERFGKGKPTTKDVAAIYYACAKAGRKSHAEPVVSFQEWGSIVLRRGLMNVAADAFNLVAYVLSGDESEGTEEKKGEATSQG